MDFARLSYSARVKPTQSRTTPSTLYHTKIFGWGRVRRHATHRASSMEWIEIPPEGTRPNPAPSCPAYLRVLRTIKLRTTKPWTIKAGLFGRGRVRGHATHCASSMEAIELPPDETRPNPLPPLPYGIAYRRVLRDTVGSYGRLSYGRLSYGRLSKCDSGGGEYDSSGFLDGSDRASPGSNAPECTSTRRQAFL